MPGLTEVWVLFQLQVDSELVTVDSESDRRRRLLACYSVACQVLSGTQCHGRRPGGPAAAGGAPAVKIMFQVTHRQIQVASVRFRTAHWQARA